MRILAWPELEPPPVTEDQPIPKWTKWRSVHPPLEPVACAVCPADVREFYVLLEGHRYCLRHGLDALSGSK